MRFVEAESFHAQSSTGFHLFTAFLTLVLLHLMIVTAHGALPDPGRICGSPSMQTAAPSGRIVVRLAAGSGLAVGDQGLQTRPGLAAGQMTASYAQSNRLASLIARTFPGRQLAAHFTGRTVRSAREVVTGGLPDLTRYGHIDTDITDRDALMRLVAQLNDDPAVDLAFLEPKTVPAALGFDAFTGTYTPPPPPVDKTGPVPPTPDFTTSQGYLGAAPLGINALAAHAFTGALGAGVTVVDIEGAWLWAHEDLPDPVLDLNVHYDDLSWRNHGTAVLGEIRGTSNGFGVTGIAPSCNVGASSIGDWRPTAQAIVAAADTLDPGDIILIELHSPGPRTYDASQFGYMPMEFWQDNFDAIQYATSLGLIVVEAAGNGYQDLDDPIYMALFDRTIRDSGAIICGATEGSTLVAASFSNHGERVDLNGWGRNVTTCAYGNLQGGLETEWYTNSFSGTSSASPIVTGAVASLQGMARAMNGFDVDARLARDILRDTGTAITGTHLIGMRPNLVDAHDLAIAQIAEITGTVTDQATGLPLSGVRVSVSGQGSFTATDASGHWRLPLLAGSMDLEFYSFYHEAQTHPVTLTAGQSSVLDVQLSQLVLIDLTGQVLSSTMTLGGAVVTPLSHPIPGTIADGSGHYTLSGIPVGHIYTVLFDGVPGFGPRLKNIPTAGATDYVVFHPILTLSSESFESDDGGFTSAHGLWSHGPPPAAVVGDAFHGTQCWGVGMGGTYSDSMADTLTSPVYDLSLVNADEYYLSFHYYAATEPQYDGVHLEVSSGAGYELLVPLTAYTDVTIDGLMYQTGWSGNSGRWTGAVFDITAFTGGDFSFRLNFGSDMSVFENGFYLDCITFSDNPRTSAAPQDEVPIAAVSSLRAWPNPFNPHTTIAFNLAQPGPVHLAVYDVSGRLVKTLIPHENRPAGENRVDWNGRDASGRAVSAGVYFYNVRTGSFNQTRRMTLLK